MNPTFLERLKAAPVTVVLTLVNFAWFLLAEHHGSTLKTSTLLQFGAVERIHVWAGEYWRLGSYMFLHIGWIHILWNTWASWSICTAMERHFGSKGYLLIYLVAGVGGGCFAVLFSHSVVAGASGAMFGVIGADLTARYDQLRDVRAFFADRAVRSSLTNIAIWTALMYFAFQSSKGGGVSHAGHAGGFVLGIVGAFVVLRKNLVLRLGAALGVAALIVLACRPGWRPTGEDETAALDFAVFDMRNGQTARGERIAKKACAAGIEAACALRPGPPPGAIDF